MQLKCSLCGYYDLYVANGNKRLARLPFQVSYEQLQHKGRRKSGSESESEAAEEDELAAIEPPVRQKSPLKRMMSVEETHLQNLVKLSLLWIQDLDQFLCRIFSA